MKKQRKNRKAGFTLVETLVAIIVLSIALNALFTLISGSLFHAKYARNEITATYLAQEAIDRIRNDRDTIAFQKYNNGDWGAFLSKYGYDINNPSNKVLCFSSDGCSFDASSYDLTPTGCSFSSCPKLHYNPSISEVVKSYYNYDSFAPETSFERRIKMDVTNGGKEVDIKVRVRWLNGSTYHYRTIIVSLLEWS